MWRTCVVTGVLALAGCGEIIEPAIARGRLDSTEDAARAQVGELFRRGPEGMVELAGLLRHADVTEFHVAEVFRRLPSDHEPEGDALRLRAAPLVEPLVELAEDPTRTFDMRRSALAALSQLGDGGRPFAPRIWPLVDEPELFTAAWGALHTLRWEPLIDVLIRTLDADHRGHRLGAIKHLGEFGPKAARAVPALSRRLLDDEPLQEREEIIEALRQIGTAEARATLIQTLDSPRWRDVKRGTLAVLELSLFEAEPHLRRLSHRHWRAPVRRLAEVAADALQRRRRGEAPQANHVKFTSDCLPDWKTPAVVLYAGRPLQVPYVERDRRPERPADFPRDVDFGDDASCVRDYARIDGGWAVAIDCGEWGGSVLFVGAEGNKRVLSPMESDQFVRFDDRLFAIGGCDHMGLNYGNIVEVVRGGDGRWKARENAQPTGTPHARLLTADGIILVSGSGAMLLRRDGSQEELSCTAPGQPRSPEAGRP